MVKFSFIVSLHRFLRKQKKAANGLLESAISVKQEWGENIREAGKEKNKSNVMHCGTATEETDWVVRSRRMTLERLCGTFHLRRVYCRDLGIYLSSFPSLVLYWSKSKQLSPGDIWIAAEKARVSPCQLVMSVDVPFAFPSRNGLYLC